MSKLSKLSEPRSELCEFERGMIIGVYHVGRAKPAKIAVDLSLSDTTVRRIIEHLWDELGRRAKRHTPRNLEELADCLKQEWDNMPDDVDGHLVASMKRRVDKVIAAKGYPTRY